MRSYQTRNLTQLLISRDVSDECGSTYPGKLEHAGEVWEGNAKFVKQLETVSKDGSS